MKQLASGLAAGACASTAFGATLARARDDKSPAAGTKGRVLILGDSHIGGALGIFLQRLLRDQDAFDVERVGKASSGLARPDFFDWPTVAKEQFEAFRPQLTVCMFGGNDGQGLHMGRKAEPEWIRYGEPGWDEEYVRRINGFADALTPSGEMLLWLGMPNVRPEKLNRRLEHMNALFVQEMDRRGPFCEFVDIWDVLANPEGEYTDHIEVHGKETRVRTGDGVHFSGAGAEVLTHFIAPFVRREMGCRPA